MDDCDKCIEAAVKLMRDKHSDKDLLFDVFSNYDRKELLYMVIEYLLKDTNKDERDDYIDTYLYEIECGDTKCTC